MRAPKCSKGTRSAHKPRLPPTIDGEADKRRPCFSLNGCGLKRDTQSIEFFSAPGIEALYSGELITKASLVWMHSRNLSAPGGNPSSFCTSALYEGVSKSGIDVTSTAPPLASIVVAARRASRPLSESALKEAEKTRKRTGSRSCAARKSESAT